MWGFLPRSGKPALALASRVKPESGQGCISRAVLGVRRDEKQSSFMGWAAENGRLIRRRRAAGLRVRREGGPARPGGKLGCAVVRHS